MPVNLKGRSLLTLDELSAAEIRLLLRLPGDLKAAQTSGTEQPRLKGKNTALIFEKDPTRTRTGFEVAAYDQGAHADFMAMREFTHKHLSDMAVVFIGDVGNNVARSLALGAVKLGMDMRLCGPSDLWPDQDFASSSAITCAARRLWRWSTKCCAS